jgi:hypothetical protein
MTQTQLNKIIERHQHYLNKDVDGWEDMRADLSHQDLCEANLRGANLNYVDLRKANLYGADLREADLYGADLREANLCRADLRKANLYGADFRKANLYVADLRKADLYAADLSGADLTCADLRNAYLRDASLFDAHCRYANMYGADLRNANITYAIIGEDTKIDYPLACPETGSFIGYKKARYGYIVKLQICEDAKRSSATTKKCRCSKALVLAIENMDGSDSGLQEIESNFDPSFIYRVGEIVEVSDFDDNRWNGCAPGIHFFVDRQDAVEYEF